MSSCGGLSAAATRGPLLLPRPSSNLGPPFMNFGPISSSSSSSSVNGRSQALKVHSQAEKRRRERINTHLSTLRRMVPSDATTKMDKAALLGRVIDHVKDLKRKAVDIGKGFSIPTEANEVIVESRDQQSDDTTSENREYFCIKVSVCCEDRPDLFASLIKAFHGLRLRAVRADITSLGGRVQSVFILCGRREQHMSNGSVASLSSLKESIKDAFASIASFDDVVSMNGPSSKRQRLLQSCYSNVSI